MPKPPPTSDTGVYETRGKIGTVGSLFGKPPGYFQFWKRQKIKPESSTEDRDYDELFMGVELGKDMMIMMMRSGNLRLSPMPFEKGQYPYKYRLRPIKATKLIWSSWYRETFGDRRFK